MARKKSAKGAAAGKAPKKAAAGKAAKISPKKAARRPRPTKMPIVSVSALTALAAAPAPPSDTRAKVHACVRAAAPGRPFDDDSELGSIPVQRTDDVGNCLNGSLPLNGQFRYGSGDIPKTWTVRMLTSDAHGRRMLQG